MTNTQIRHGLRTGLIAGFVLVFLAITGFAFTLATSLSNSLLGFLPSAERGYQGMMLLLLILGIWHGTRAATRIGPDTWMGAVLSGLVAGLVSGLALAIFAILVGRQVEAGVNLRRYLVALSPTAVDLLLLGRSAVSGAVMLLGIVTAATVLGAVLNRALGREALPRARAALGSGVSSVSASMSDKPVVRYITYFLVLALLVWVPTVLNQSLNYTLGTVAIYVLLGLGLNIVVGLAGLLDLGYVAFFAVGAYTVALLTAPDPHGVQANFWIILPLAVAFAALAGVLLGVPVLRLRGDYLAIVTLGFGEIIRVLAGSDALTGFTGGPMGVNSVPLPRFFGQPLGPQHFVYLLIVGVALVIFVTARLQNSRVGRAWIAMREDETVAQAMGINTLRYKLLAFGIGAAFAGMGGALFAARNQFTNPQDHVLLVSINVLAVVIVGGMGSIPGVILGAFVLKGIPELLREFENYRIILFGGLLVLMMILRPEGLIPSRRRKLEMHESEEEAKEEIPPDPSVGGEVFA